MITLIAGNKVSVLAITLKQLNRLTNLVFSCW